MITFSDVISLMTFPGILTHRLVYELLCRTRRIAVFEVSYYQFKHPHGAVAHEPVEKPVQKWLSLTTSFVNSLLAFLIAAPGAITIFTFESGGPIDFILVWLGFSLALHAFPVTLAVYVWLDIVYAAFLSLLLPNFLLYLF